MFLSHTEIQCWKRTDTNPVIMTFTDVQTLGSGGLKILRLSDGEGEETDTISRRLATSDGTFQFNCILSETNMKLRSAVNALV